MTFAGKSQLQPLGLGRFKLRPIALCRSVAAAAILGTCIFIGPLQAKEAGPAELSAAAEALRIEILDLQVNFASLARRVRAHEQALASAEKSLSELELAQEEKLEALARQRQNHYLTLAALQRLALHPRAAVAVTSAQPTDVLRGALLLKTALPALENQANDLRLSLEELDALRHAILEEQKAIANATVALEQRRLDVARLIARKKGVLETTEVERERAAARATILARQAADLHELMALAAKEEEEPEARVAEDEHEATAAEAETTDNTANDNAQSPTDTQVALLERPDTVRSFPSEPGHILLPVAGHIVHRFGEHASRAEGLDPVLEGITIRTRAGAEVVAPYDGKVVYAGDFRSYGQILIIDHGGQYHTLLAGLHRIRAVVGQWVLAGEPVATMSTQDSDEPELYLELRQTGQPINPLPWLAEGERKARG